MSIRYHARMVVALLAAYAVALQSILLVVTVPVTGAKTQLSGESAALPLCSRGGSGHSVPVNRAHDCLGACVAGCCGSSPAAPHSVAIALDLPPAGQAVSLAFERIPVLPFGAAGAHRCRAPPLA
jgi:hypothetical protein